MKPLVSIIVPIYNSEKYLDLCILSLIKQTYKNLEIILVDDGSQDNSSIICKKYAKQDNRIKYIYKKNSGVSDTRNVGINISSGQYITFVDSDDYIGVKSLDTLVNKTTKEKIVSMGHYNVYSSKIEKNVYEVNRLSTKELMPNIFDSRIKGISVGYLFDAATVKKVLFNKDINYLEDMLFLTEYFKKTNKKTIEFLECKKEIAYYYVCNPNSTTVSAKNMIDKYRMMNKALYIINNTTDNKYVNLIENKRVELLENSLRYVTSKAELLDFQKEFSINKYRKKNLRYNFFSFLYRHKFNCLLIIYFQLRKDLKLLYLKIKRRKSFF